MCLFVSRCQVSTVLSIGQNFHGTQIRNRHDPQAMASHGTAQAFHSSCKELNGPGPKVSWDAQSILYVLCIYVICMYQIVCVNIYIYIYIYYLYIYNSLHTHGYTIYMHFCTCMKLKKQLEPNIKQAMARWICCSSGWESCKKMAFLKISCEKFGSKTQSLRAPALLMWSCIHNIYIY